MLIVAISAVSMIVTGRDIRVELRKDPLERGGNEAEGEALLH